MTDLLTADDLTPFATIESDKCAAMIADAVAMAVINAPCLGDTDSLTDAQAAAAKAVLRGAVLRWNQTGTGAVTTQAMGGITATVDTRQPRRQMFWPSEIVDLQKICKATDGSDGGIFSIDTAPDSPMLFHSILEGSSFDGQYGEFTVGAIAFESDDDDDPLYFG